MSVLEPAAGIEEDYFLIITDPALAPQMLESGQCGPTLRADKDPLGVTYEPRPPNHFLVGHSDGGALAFA